RREDARYTGGRGTVRQAVAPVALPALQLLIMNGEAFSRLARRRFLQAGTLALFAGAAPVQTVRAFGDGSTAPPSFGRAKRCILVYLLGGPPQIDMWDMKPQAPVEIRGPFKPIASAVPGMQFCEHLPRLAGEAKELAILRSVT